MRPSPMTVHLDPEERAALDRVARAQSRTRGNVIRLALRRYIEAEQKTIQQSSTHATAQPQLAA